VETIVKSRPAGAKGQFVRSMTLATSMGPGIKLEPGSTLALSTT
jgi:large subunit ribosomal protein L1